MGKVSKFYLLLVGLAISLSFVVGWTANAHEEKSTVVWEYRYLSQTYIGGKAVDLNALGAEGWELVAVTSPGVLNEKDGFTGYYFKRRK